MKQALAFACLVVLGSVVLSAAAGTPAAKPLSVHQAWSIRHLVAPGDRVEIGYAVDTPGVKSVTGSLYVRNDLKRSFERVALRRLRAVVPQRLIRGHGLFYYAVLRDPRNGRAVRVPAGSPETAWVLEQPAVVSLGTHRFGHPRAPGAVVARAGPTEVGFQTGGDPFGPQTFQVGRDRSVWLFDSLDGRLLVWRRGAPDSVARTVPLPLSSPDSAFALGPAGTVYLTKGVPNPPRIFLYRLSSSGDVLWQSTLASEISNMTLRIGPDGALFFTPGLPGGLGGERAWRPAATGAGKPLSQAAQARRTLWSQQMAGGLRLVYDCVSCICDCGETMSLEKSPKEIRFALVDRRNRVVRSWRVTSRTRISPNNITPELIGGDPVVVVDVTRGSEQNFKWEYEVLRLGSKTRFSLRRSIYGDSLFADVLVGPDGGVYQLGSSPATGVTISRYTLGRKAA